MKTFLAFLFFILSVNSYAQQLTVSPEVKKGMDRIDTNRIHAVIEYLADDRLKGRKPGTEGYKLAADYIVENFKKIGLLPAGDKDSYFQSLILRKAIIDPASFKAEWKDKNGTTELYSKSDIQFIPHPLKTEINISAPLVFAGYGTEIPGGYSDYKGIDVKGKIVVVLRGTPPGLQSTLAAHFNRAGSKMVTAFKKGAVGLIIANPVPTSSPATATANFPSLTVSLNPEKTIVYGSGATGDLALTANMSLKGLNFLFTASEKNFDQVFAELKSGNSQSFDLNGDLTVSYKNSYEDIVGYNIIGKIEGTDKNLKNEYVVHSAHLDHIGIGRPVNGDSIYNGAHDNASGVASLLEIARLYKEKGIAPKRSILIAMVTSEEAGLVGSHYFASNPTVPITSIVADVNTDMPTFIAPLLSIVPLGAEHSSLMKNVQFAASYLKLDIEPDPEPSENRFVRSDQYSFVMQGIPALNIKYGNKTNTPGFDLGAFIKNWRAKYYHQPADGIDGIFYYPAAITYVQLNFLISYSIAQTTKRPTWNPGDLFGK